MLYRLLVESGGSNEPFASAHLNQLRPCRTTNALRAIMQFILRGGGQYKPVLMRFYRQDKTRYRINGNNVEEALADLKIRSDYLFQDYYSNAMRDAVRVFGSLAANFEKDYVDVEIMIHRSSAY